MLSNIFQSVDECGLGFFFFNNTPPTEIYTLSLHDALPISAGFEPNGGRREHVLLRDRHQLQRRRQRRELGAVGPGQVGERSEEHTSELQSRQYLVCRLLLEKKKKHLTHS